MNELPAPHGGRLVQREPVGSERREALAEAAHLPALPIGDPQLAHLEAIATGVLSPLEGFMDRDQCRSVLAEARLPGPDGAPWPTPILLSAPEEWTHARRLGQRVALVDTAGQIRGILELRDVFGVPDGWWRDAGIPGPTSPAVRFLGGPVWLLKRRAPRFPRQEEDPAEVRATIAARGWRTTACLPVGDVLHRDGEYVMKTCLETVDGVLLHAVVSDADDPRDFPAPVRLRCLQTLLRHYVPPGRVHLGVLGVAEPLGSPRQALLAGIVAQNHGCTHVIVTPEVAGDDGARVGEESGLEAARALYEEFSGEMAIVPLFFGQPVHCDSCGGMVTDKTCPHGAPDRVMMSRERLRRLLFVGIRPPVQYMRPEIADVLCEWARGTL